MFPPSGMHINSVRRLHRAVADDIIEPHEIEKYYKAFTDDSSKYGTIKLKNILNGKGSLARMKNSNKNKKTGNSSVKLKRHVWTDAECDFLIHAAENKMTKDQIIEEINEINGESEDDLTWSSIRGKASRMNIAVKDLSLSLRD